MQSTCMGQDGQWHVFLDGRGGELSLICLKPLEVLGVCLIYREVSLPSRDSSFQFLCSDPLQGPLDSPW